MRARISEQTSHPEAPSRPSTGSEAHTGQMRCDHCRELFTPPRPWSRFCCEAHRRAFDSTVRALASRLLAHTGPVTVHLTPGEEPVIQTELPLDTRRAALRNIEGRAQRLREAVLETLRQHGPCTADEAATLLGESPLSIRPRFSELRKDDEITDTGERRQNRSGNTARVWRVA